MAEEHERAERERVGRSVATLTATLDSIETHLREQGASLPDHLAPGLTDDEIDHLLEPAGVQLNEVNRALFRWHDGAPTGNDAVAGMPPYDVIGPLGWQFRPLRDLVTYYLGPWTDDSVEHAPDWPEFGPGGAWGRRWFPLLTNADGRTAIATPASQDRWSSQQPIYSGGGYDLPDDGPRMTSIIPLFQFLALWLEHGYLRWEPAGQDWTYSRLIHPMTFRATWWW